MRDKIAKGFKYGKAGEEKLFDINPTQNIRDFFRENFGTLNTTEEYIKRIEKEGNYLQRGIIGVGSSLPAMIGPPLFRYASMYNMIANGVREEMESDPDFDNISESEKQMTLVPISIIGTALEEVGFRNLLKGKSIIGDITKRVLGKVPVGASASQIRSTALAEIKEMGLRGTLALTGSMLAEAETGAAQQASDYLVKDIYNVMKGKKMFDTPIAFSAEYFKNIGDAALVEGIGSAPLAIPNAIHTAFTKDGFQGLDDNTFKMFEELSKNSDSKKFFVIDLKNKINSGEITKKQADDILNVYDKSSGLVQQIPDEITDVNDKKKAMDLLKERKSLEDKIQGKDPALTKPIQNQINQINEQLNAITENAIQKQTAGEVSVQPEAGVSEEVEGGEPETKPEAVTEEGVLTTEESKQKSYKDQIRTKAKEEISKVLDNEELTEQQKEAEVEKIVKEAKSQMEIDVENISIPNALTDFSNNITLSPESGFKKALLDLGYSEADISNMTFEQQQEIVNNGTKAPEVASSAKVDSVKENKRQERIAEMQAELDAEQEVAPTEEVAPTAKIFAIAPPETKKTIIITSPEGKELPLNGNEQEAGNLYDEAVAIPESERTPEQNDIIQKLEPIVIEDEVAKMERLIEEGKKKPEVTPTTKEQQAKEVVPAVTEEKVTTIQITPTEPEVYVPKDENIGSKEYRTKAPKHVTGRTRERTIADGTKIKGRYKLVSADEVLASHNEETFAKTEGFPVNEQGKTVNDRDYETDKAAQSEVIRIVGRLDERAISQTPIVTKDGIVVDGNNRTMSRKLAAKQGTDASYIEALRQDADMYGIDPNEIDNVKNPMLVFEAEQEIPYTTKEFSRFNKAEKKEKSPIEKAVELSKTVTDRFRRMLGSIYDKAKNPSDVTSNPSTMSEVRDLLLAEGILQPNELPRYINPESGTATKEGVAFLETLLIGSALSENTIRTLDNEGMGNAKRRIIESVVQITKNAGLGINSLQKNIENGIKLLGKAIATNQSVTDVIRQMDLFEISEFSAEDLAVAVLLDGDGFKKFLQKYNSEVGTESFFGSITKEGLIDELLNNKIKGYEQIRKNLRTDVKTGQAEVQASDGGVKPEEQEIKGEKLSDKVRNLKIKGPGGLQSNIFGVPIAIWNTAMDTVAAAIDAGVAISDALSKGYAYIKEKHKAIDTKRYEAKILSNIYSNAIQLARENKISDKGIEAYLKKKGLTEEQAKALLKIKPKAEKKPISKEKIIGKPKPKKVTVNEMTALKNKIQDQIKAARDGAKSVTDAVKAIVGYVNKMADRGNLTRKDLRKILNLIPKVKDQKSLDKTADAIYEIIKNADTDIIEVSDYKVMINQIKLEAKAAREAKGDLNAKRKMLAEAISDMVKKGKISAVQARALINRVNKVNLDNPIMVERLLTYAENIFNDADYDVRMNEVRALQSKAKRTKHVSMKDKVKEFVSINPELIPAERILDYIQALDDLNTRTPAYEKMNNMFDEIMSYQQSIDKEFDAIKTFEKLNEKFKSITLNQVKSVEDYVNLIRDINSFKRKAAQLLENGAITQEEYDNFKFIDQETIEKKYEKELSILKRKLIDEIESLAPTENTNYTPEQNDKIRKYNELKRGDLMQLAPEDLYVLNDLLENMKNGEMMDYYRFSDIVSKAYTKQGAKETAEQLKKSNFNLNTDRGIQLLSEYESAFWEGLLGLGRVTSGALQKYIISPFNRAIASYEDFLTKGYNVFSKLKKQYKINTRSMNKIGMLTTYLQEYMSQFDPDSKNIKDIGTRDWFRTILDSKDMRDDYKSAKTTVSRLFGKAVNVFGNITLAGKSQIELIEEIWNSLPKDANGNVDPKAVYDSFVSNDGKFFSKNEKEFFDKVMEWKEKNITPKQRAANELRGNPFKELPFHVMRVRLGDKISQVAPKATSANGMIRIEAGTGKERTDFSVGAIDTNFEELFIKNIEATSRDFFLSDAIKDINNVLAGVAPKLEDKDMPLFKTITNTLSEALNFEFNKQSSAILSTLLSARAAQTLLAPSRMIVELATSLISYPIRAKNLTGYKDLFSNVRNMGKLLEFTESPIRLRENISSAIDLSDGQIKRMNALQRWTLFLAGLPERAMMVTSWMPNFRAEFKNATGVDFDMEAFKNDAKYRSKYGKEIRNSASVADAQTEKIIGSTTKAGQRRNIRIAPKFLANLFGQEGTVSKNTVYGQVFGFFTNYPYREVTEFVNGFREAAQVIREEGKAEKTLRQLAKPLGIATNVMLYRYLSAVSYGFGLILLGGDDDEERGKKFLSDLTTTEGLTNEFTSGALSLAGSQYGAGSRMMVQLGGTIAMQMTDDEKQKEWIKKIMKSSFYVDPIPVEAATKFGGKKEIAQTINSYIPQFVLATDRIIDMIGTVEDIGKLYDKVEKDGIMSLTEDEAQRVALLNVTFNATQLALNVFYGASIPEYNKAKIYVEGLKDDATQDNKEKKEEAYGGYKTIEELKEKDPKLYREKSKKGGDLYEYRKEQKEKREEKEKAEGKSSKIKKFNKDGSVRKSTRSGGGRGERDVSR